MKPKWWQFDLTDDGEINVRRDVDHNGVPFLDVIGIGEQLVVQPDAGNHVRIYLRSSFE